MESVYLELTVIICIAAGLSVLFKYLKQPAILAYILTGVLLGPLGVFKIGSGEVIHALGQIGITLLLFMLGLELRISELRAVGKVAVLTGFLQIILTGIFGFFLSQLLGYDALTSVYVSIGLTFSSTIIIVKLLSDKKDLNSLHGKIAIGILLMQDFVAILALIILSGFNSGISSMSILFLLLKAYALFGWTIVLSRTLLPKLLIHLAKSSEVLFLFSLAWAFGIAALVSSPMIGFSIEIGGFLAGLSLANSAENFQIISKVKSLRDFFITIFFVNLGMGLIFENMLAIWLPAVILTVFILIGKPLIVMGILGYLGYRKRTSFMVGLTASQISEFSMIVIFLGNKIGHVPHDVLTLITVLGTLSFVLSTYMMMNNNRLFYFFEKYLDMFERQKTKEKRIDLGVMKDHIIIVGGDQMGRSVLNALEHENEKVVLVDFNPSIVHRLQKAGINVLYGDISDTEIQNHVQLENARLVISTIPDVEDNMLLIDAVKHANKKTRIIVMSYEIENAKQLYKAGADYVILPHLAGGRHLAKILIDKKQVELIEKYKARDLAFTA